MTKWVTDFREANNEIECFSFLFFEKEDIFGWAIWCLGGLYVELYTVPSVCLFRCVSFFVCVFCKLADRKTTLDNPTLCVFVALPEFFFFWRIFFFFLFKNSFFGEKMWRRMNRSETSTHRLCCCSADDVVVVAAGVVGGVDGVVGGDGGDGGEDWPAAGHRD